MLTPLSVNSFLTLKMIRLLRYIGLLLFIVLCQLTAANIDIRLSNNNSYGTNSRGSYNIDASETSNGGVDGGIVVLITDGGIDTDFKVYVQYHTGNPADGNIWYAQPINTAGNTKIRTDAAVDATAYISHLAIKSSDDYQGDDYSGNVTFIIVNDDADAKVIFFVSSIICALIFLADLLMLNLNLSVEETFLALFLTLNFFLSIFVIFIIFSYLLFLKYTDLVL